MKTLLLTLALSIAAGQVNAADLDESVIEDKLFNLKSEELCLSKLDDMTHGKSYHHTFIDAMTDFCMDQDYNN